MFIQTADLADLYYPLHSTQTIYTLMNYCSKLTFLLAPVRRVKYCD